MVTIKLQGGCCNQMFQMAFIYAYAKKHGLEYCVPYTVENPHIAGKGAYIFPGINYSDTIPELPIWKEPHFHYAEIPKMDDVCFYGFFQSWRYFNDYRGDLLKAFGMDGFPTNYDQVSIHLRMSDYTLYPAFHPLVSLDYLDKAISLFSNGDYAFQIFSDDREAAVRYLPREFFNGQYYEFEETGDELIDLKYMAMCEHNITANSSFSWWAAYINPNPKKKIVMPEGWFGIYLPHNTKDLYLPNAIII